MIDHELLEISSNLLGSPS